MVNPNDISAAVVDTSVKIHSRLGPGLLESSYQAILAYELERRGLRVRKEVPIPVVWEGLTLDTAFRADLVIEDAVIVELKSVEQVAPVHKKQLLSYLKLADKRLGCSSTSARTR